MVYQYIAPQNNCNSYLLGYVLLSQFSTFKKILVLTVNEAEILA
jgi:hypothetical protein